MQYGDLRLESRAEAPLGFRAGLEGTLLGGGSRIVIIEFFFGSIFFFEMY
jgi:hypothetical protein